MRLRFLALPLVVVAACIPRNHDSSDVAQDSSGLDTNTELARIEAHVASLYGDDDVRDRFIDDVGDAIDCVDFTAQPGVRLQGVDAIGGRMPDALVDDHRTSVQGEESAELAHRRACPEGTVSMRHCEKCP